MDRMVVTQARNKGKNGKLVFTEYRVKIMQYEKVLEMGYITIRMYLTLLNCTIKT
jgi:hypothetical protein